MVNAAEALQLLNIAAIGVDNAILPASELDRRLRAEVWADLLSDIRYDVGVEAMRQHYRTSTKPLTPAAIRAIAAPPTPATVTYLDQVRAADTRECDHGEPRGARYCAFCRRAGGPVSTGSGEQIDPRVREAAQNITHHLGRGTAR